ncbi:MAG: PIN domain-containing protein [Proteobacteria bacterium]|nr:PIN domain-containing protein [Pseudomonadota bacterium]
MTSGFFFDSYAVVELIQASPNYELYKEEPVTITQFNLAEIYWFALLRLDAKTASTIFDRFRPCVVDVDDATLKEAIQFRKTHKKRDLSYADCIGYIYAKRHGLRFLTGDKEFEDLPNVEFVK